MGPKTATFGALWLLCYFATVSCSTEFNYSEGQTVVNPPRELDGSTTVVSPVSKLNRTEDAKEIRSLQQSLNFYNVQLLGDVFDGLRSELSTKCADQVESYLEGYRHREKWAIRMDDAAGHYSSGWFWGNNYWVGSKLLCENISPDKRPDVQKLKDRKSRALTPSNTAGYSSEKTTDPDTIAPFPLGFFVVKLFVDTNATLEAPDHILYLGVCLPLKCSDDDTTNLLNYVTHKSNTGAKIDVIGIRSDHQYWSIWEDGLFQFMSIITLGVILLLGAGTGYDLHLRQQLKKKNNLQVNYNVGATNLPDDNVRVDVPATDKTPNGNSGIYVVNTGGTASTDNLENTSIESDVERKLGIFEQLLLSFSVLGNVEIIFEKSVGNDTLPTIHGLRSISMAWVILGHFCINSFKYSDNMQFRNVIERDALFQMILNATFSVDTFFFISGLLVSFLYFRTNANGKLERLTKGSKGFIAGTLHFIGLLAYRFARLTVPYLYVLGLVVLFMKWFNYNSIFEPPFQDHETCPKYWWRNILYINTYFPVQDMCMIWSWYLADDTQFYIVGAIILIVAARHFKTATGALSVLLLSSWLTTGYIAYSNRHMPTMDDPLALFDKIYDKPWTRLGPYLVGMCSGWLLFKTNCRIKMSTLSVACGWFISLGLLTCLIFGLFSLELNPVAAAAYSSLSHTVWAACLSWIVIACSTGHGGYINWFLSNPVLYPLSRITYCAYLVHPMVIRWTAINQDSPLHLGKEFMASLYFGVFVLSYGLGFFISIAFEAPVVTMLKILAPNKGKKIR